jgi:hypothetical protein
MVGRTLGQNSSLLRGLYTVCGRVNATTKKHIHTHLTLFIVLYVAQVDLALHVFQQSARARRLFFAVVGVGVIHGKL